MTPEEAGDIDTERRLEERHEKEWEKKQKRRAPKSPTITFQITCSVPVREWKALQKEGFKEADLPDMVAGMIRDISEQVPGIDEEQNREMSFIPALS
jgi:hypothetical protein